MIGPSGASDATAVGSGYGEMLVGSLLVLGLVCLGAWLVVRLGARRLWAPRGGGVLDVLARVPLEPRRSLYVVEVAGKTLLVGTSEMGLSVLSELDAERVRAELGSRPAGRSFADAVRAVLAARRAPAGSGRRDGGGAGGGGGGLGGDGAGGGGASLDGGDAGEGGDGRRGGDGGGGGHGFGGGRGGGGGFGGGRGGGDADGDAGGGAGG